MPRKFNVLPSIIPKEVKQMNSFNAWHLLASYDGRRIWQWVSLLRERKTKPISFTADVESINKVFTYSCGDSEALCFLDECANVRHFSKERFFKHFRPAKINRSTGYDSMSSPLINYRAASFTDAFNPILSISLRKRFILECWKLVTSVSSTKSGALLIQNSRFRSSLRSFSYCSPTW